MLCPPQDSDEASSHAEEDRLAALRRTALLDTAPEELFDRYVRLAARIADAPVAAISLVDRHRQWFKASQGLATRETPRAWAFCDHAIESGAFFEIEDARADARFRDNPLVTGEPHVRFYAGAPVILGGNAAIGTLCAIDEKPKRLSADQREALSDLAAVLSREIETNHLAEVRADRAAAARAAAVEIQHQMRNMFSKVGAIIDMSAREADGTEAMADAARRRIVALAQANEVALRNDFRLAPLREVAEAALRHVVNRTGVSIDAVGEDVAITPAAASVIAPLIGELAHDAEARGALTSPTAASLSWERVDADLLLRWRETGPAGPDAYASAYLTDVAPSALRGQVTSDSRGYALQVPFAAVRAEA